VAAPRFLSLSEFFLIAEMIAAICFASSRSGATCFCATGSVAAINRSQ
jgi:hypothetical protein